MARSPASRSRPTSSTYSLAAFITAIAKSARAWSCSSRVNFWEIAAQASSNACMTIFTTVGPKAPLQFSECADAQAAINL
jgi:hypothetical protein